MRRKDKEITDSNDILQVLDRADAVHLALSDGETPYVVPMNFGFRMEEDGLYLYFHCAREGKKLDILRKNPRAAFSACPACSVQTDGAIICNSSTGYESVCGCGTVELLPPEKSAEALDVIIAHYTGEKTAYGPNQLRATLAFRLKVAELTGKRSLPKNAI